MNSGPMNSGPMNSGPMNSVGVGVGVGVRGSFEGGGTAFWSQSSIANGVLGVHSPQFHYSTRTRAHAHMHTNTLCIRTHARAHIRTHTHACMRAHTDVDTHTHTHTYTGVEPSAVLTPPAGTGIFWRGHTMHAGLPVTSGVRSAAIHIHEHAVHVHHGQIHACRTPRHVGRAVRCHPLPSALFLSPVHMHNHAPIYMYNLPSALPLTRYCRPPPAITP